MQQRSVKRKYVVVFISALCLIMLSAISVLSQRIPSSIERRVETMNRQGNEYEREDLRRDMEGKNKKPDDPKRKQQIVAEVKEDFEHIQLVYNRLILALSEKKELDYKFIAETVADAKKRANRLKINLALPKVEDENKDEKKEDKLSQEQLKPSLLSLSKHIYNFVTNPQFESSGALDVQLATKASSDLEQIIKLSDSIEKSTGELKKPD